MSTLARPLDGLVVVALEQAVAAPFATSRLADAGARVIKIERPGGDFARGYDRAAKGESSYFVWLNRGKESLVLDLSAEQDRARLAELVAEADVFVQNLKPGAARRLGFDPAALLARHKRLICCSISGYDGSGANGDRKAYDLLVQADSGLASITGGPNEPARVGISIVDIATGATAHAAILEALIGRGINGEGADIRVSMFDVMADWLTVPLLNHEAGSTPKRIGLSHPSIAPYGAFSTSCGDQILIAIQSEREWAALCEHVLAAPDAVVDPATATNVERVRNRKRTDGLVAQALGRMTRAQATAALDRSGIAYALVNDMDGLSRHPELQRIEVSTDGGTVSYPRPGAQFCGSSRRYGGVPGIGKNGNDAAD